MDCHFLFVKGHRYIPVLKITRTKQEIVGDKIFELLFKKRSPKAETALRAPTSKIGSRWDLEIDYFSSKSDHMLYLE